MPALTICIDCPALIRQGPRCEPCRRKRVNQRSHQRGTRQAQGYDAEYQRARRLVLERDGYTCVYCGRPANTADHLVPLSRGGSSDPSNLRAMCLGCNSRRGRLKS